MKLLLIAMMLSALTGCVGYVHDGGGHYERDGHYVDTRMTIGTEGFARQDKLKRDGAECHP